jgi:hypothetical protein
MVRAGPASLALAAVALVGLTAGGARAGDDGAVEYQVRDDAGARPSPTDVRMSEHPAGARRCVAPRAASLRRGPAEEGATVAPSLLAGDEVVVREAGEPVVLDGRVERWLRVEASGASGWLRASEVTPACARHDLDGDGRPDVVTVRIGPPPAHPIVVLVATAAGATSEVSFPAAGQGYLGVRGGRAAIGAFVPATRARVPLVRVDSIPEACADHARVFVSAVDGTARVALTLSGLSDPPAHARAEVTFRPRARTAVVTTTATDDDHPRWRRRTTTRYRLSASGVFVKQE